MTSCLPPWFRQDIPGRETKELARRLQSFGLNTVCQEAGCPNISACFQKKKITFLILGKSCSRNCRFCRVAKSEEGFLTQPDADEPGRIGKGVAELGLDYAVVTSVSRDDLADGGAPVFARTVAEIRKASPNTKIELLIPDFQGRQVSLLRVLEAGPEVVGHNLETVPRLYPEGRPQADYWISLGVLRRIKELAPRVISKSSLMLGMGEAPEEVVGAMRDLRGCNCDILTLGQYLAPSARHYPVREFISPEKFAEYAREGEAMGFSAVVSAPKARSSYRAEEVYKEALLK